jgi:hypothetical protein
MQDAHPFVLSLGVAVLAAGRDLGAAGDWVPGYVGPFYRRHAGTYPRANIRSLRLICRSTSPLSRASRSSRAKSSSVALFSDTDCLEMPAILCAKNAPDRKADKYLGTHR